MTQQRPGFLPEESETNDRTPLADSWAGKPLPDYADYYGEVSEDKRGLPGCFVTGLLMLFAFALPLAVIVGLIAADVITIEADIEGNTLTLTAGAAALEQTRGALDLLATERALELAGTDDALVVRAQNLDATTTARANENIMTQTGIARANAALATQARLEIASTRAVLDFIETQAVLSFQATQAVGMQNATATARVATPTPSP